MPYAENTGGTPRGTAPYNRQSGSALPRAARRIPQQPKAAPAAPPARARNTASRPVASRRPSTGSAPRPSVPAVRKTENRPRPVRKPTRAVTHIEEPSVHTIKEKSSRPFPTSLVFMAMICTVLFMFVIISTVQINEYTVQIADMQGEMETLGDTAGELSSKIDKKNNMTEIEKYATDSLGMVKGDQLNKVHISTDSQDKIEVIEVEKKESGIIGSVLSAFAENFRGFLEYFG